MLCSALALPHVSVLPTCATLHLQRNSTSVSINLLGYACTQQCSQRNVCCEMPQYGTEIHENHHFKTRHFFTYFRPTVCLLISTLLHPWLHMVCVPFPAACPCATELKIVPTVNKCRELSHQYAMHHSSTEMCENHRSFAPVRHMKRLVAPAGLLWPATQQQRDQRASRCGGPPWYLDRPVACAGCMGLTQSTASRVCSMTAPRSPPWGAMMGATGQSPQWRERVGASQPCMAGELMAGRWLLAAAVAAVERIQVALVQSIGAVNRTVCRAPSEARAYQKWARGF
jgi:hypothetical protein